MAAREPYAGASGPVSHSVHMKMNPETIKDIVKGKSISDAWPWNVVDKKSVIGHIKKCIAEINRKLNLKAKSEFNHYGSGYASFVDCFFYSEAKSTKVNYATTGYTGLIVLFSRLSNFYAYGEGDKTWHKTGGSSYLPHADMVGSLKDIYNLQIIDKVNDLLAENGWQQLTKEYANQYLGFDISIPTILNDPPFKVFDAIFYWED